MEKFEQILDIMHRINLSSNLQVLLGTIINGVQNLLNVEGASFLILDEARDELVFNVVLSDKGEIIQGQRLNIGEGIAGQAALKREYILVNDVTACEHFCDDIDEISGFRTRNILAVPVLVHDKLVGVLEAVNTHKPGGFDDRDIAMMTYLANASAVAVNKHDLLKNLKNRVDELTCIYEISQSIYFTFDIDSFLARILEAVNRVIRAERCSFVILDETGLSVSHFVSTTGTSHPINLENSLMKHVIDSGDPLLVYNTAKDSGIKKSSGKEYSSNSFICVPMKLRDRVVGVLNVTDKPRGSVFDSFDLRVLSTVANQVAETYENIIREKEDVRQQRIKNELAIAGEIQRHALSRIPTDLDGMSINGFSIPAQDVGGDFYEILRYADDHVAVAVGDVSGKGVHAALYMNSLRNCLRLQAGRGQKQTVQELLNNLGEWAYSESSSGMFCTLAFADINRSSGVVTYCTLGHDPQLMLDSSTDEFHPIKTKGRPLGVSPELNFQTGSFQMKEGDALVFFTDGFIDEEVQRVVTRDRLTGLVKQHRGQGDKLTLQLNREITDAISSGKLCDDSTFLIVEMN